MSRNDQHEFPVAYPPSMTMEKQGQQLPTAPLGYPTSAVPENQVPAKTQTRGDDFWKGCCAALCGSIHTERFHQQIRDPRKRSYSRQNYVVIGLSSKFILVQSMSPLCQINNVKFLLHILLPWPCRNKDHCHLRHSDAVDLCYAIVAFWKPAFDILRDHEILPLPDHFVSMFV
uniref:Uncharacterized protein n=1 Tax=Tanacetum cinerariifolium TaxID=118510 RepID=A0A699HJH7_TANCI|nr:hypothetical protein [Tanacetum cinerariifolium]GEY38889.1 hypothetical protein [Tanacetum cinerariifolium]